MLFLLYVYTVFLMLSVFALTKQNSFINNSYISRLFLFNLLFISVFVIAITDVGYTDRIVYSNRFIGMQNLSLHDAIEIANWEPLFVVLMKLISMFTSDLIVFYVILHILFLVILFSGLRKIFSDIKIEVLVLFIYLNYSFYYSYTLNGLRQGMAMALIILALGYGIKKKSFKMMLTSITSVFLHYTTLPIALFVALIRFWKSLKIKHLIIAYFVLSILYILNLQQLLLGGLPLGEFEGYLQADAVEEFGGPNKISYLTFNTFWLLFFLFAFKNHRKDKIYIFLLKAYMLFSFYLLIFGFIAFANRIASYSWFIIPLLLGYLLKISNSGILKVVILVVVLVVGMLIGIPKYVIN